MTDVYIIITAFVFFFLGYAFCRMNSEESKIEEQEKLFTQEELNGK